MKFTTVTSVSPHYLVKVNGTISSQVSQFLISQQQE